MNSHTSFRTLKDQQRLLTNSNAYNWGGSRCSIAGTQRHVVYMNRREQENWDGDGDSSYSNYLATCIPGLSSVLADELRDLAGCTMVETRGSSAVWFRATLPQALKAFVWTRTAHKILEEVDPEYLSGVVVRDRDDVYQAIVSALSSSPALVSKLLTGRTRNRGNDNDDNDGDAHLLSLAVQVMTAGAHLPSDISHTHFTALTIKNAICDVCRDVFDGERPNVDTEQPQLPLVALIKGHDPNAAGRSFSPTAMTAETKSADLTLYRQLHSGSLHKRGYRPPGIAIHKAAMKESLAAGLLSLAGWKTIVEKSMEPNQPPIVLVDPMAGSGTLLLEATLMAADVAPGIMRLHGGGPEQKRPPFLNWSHDSLDIVDVWKQVLLDASQQAKVGLQRLRDAVNSGQIQIVGNDAHEGAVYLFESALATANLKSYVELHCSDCADADIWAKQFWTAVNDERMSDEDNNHGNLDDEADTISNRLSSARVFVVTNPPWGEKRLTDDMHDAWEALRIFLRDLCPAGRTEAWVLSGNPAATKHLGLRKSCTHVIRTGQQDLRWLQYTILDKAEKERLLENQRSKTEQSPLRNTRFTGVEKNQFEPQRRQQPKAFSAQKTYAPQKTFSKQSDTRNKSKSKPAAAKAKPANAQNEWLV